MCTGDTTSKSVIQEKDSSYSGLNNSHIIIFDLHGEYRTAFPDANHLDDDIRYCRIGY